MHLHQKKSYPKNGLEQDVVYARQWYCYISNTKGLTKYVKRQLNKRLRRQIKRELKRVIRHGDY